MRRDYRLSFTRNELSQLIDGLESLHEELSWDGGESMYVDYMPLENRILERMGLTPRWNLSAVEKVSA